MAAHDERSGGAGAVGPDEQAQHAVGELLNQYHPRASVSLGEQMAIEPSQVLDNIALAMERVDTDIDTPISIEEDVVAFDELATLIQHLKMGPALAAHVLNTGMRIMTARYPAELVCASLPPEYDLRKLFPLQIDDQQHETAKTLFNRRSASAADLTDDDVATELEPLATEGQIQIFVILFYMFGSKVGAMKYRTGIA